MRRLVVIPISVLIVLTASATASAAVTTVSSHQTGAVTAVRGGTTGVVAATPTGPNVPAGGWNVEYADAFKGCITGTTCNLPAGAPTDNSITPKTGKPSNTNEPTWYVPSQNVIDSTGLHQLVTYQPGIATGKNYAAGALKTNATNPAGGSQFQFDPGQGQTWAFEVVAKLPPTTGEEDPGYWADDSTWSWEIDFPEWWGWHSGSGGKDWLQSNGDGMGFPAIPKCGCGSTGNVSFYWNGSPPLTWAPDAAYHTYTVEMIGTTMFSWVDGVPYGTGRVYGPVGSWSKNLGNLILQHSLRDPTTGNPSPYFMSGSRSFDVKSIAVYENASANNANTRNPTIAPGTTVQ